jgi:hypothetical protein
MHPHTALTLLHFHGHHCWEQHRTPIKTSDKMVNSENSLVRFITAGSITQPRCSINVQTKPFQQRCARAYTCNTKCTLLTTLVNSTTSVVTLCGAQHIAVQTPPLSQSHLCMTRPVVTMPLTSLSQSRMGRHNLRKNSIHSHNVNSVNITHTCLIVTCRAHSSILHHTAT